MKKAFRLIFTLIFCLTVISACNTDDAEETVILPTYTQVYPKEFTSPDDTITINYNDSSIVSIIHQKEYQKITYQFNYLNGHITSITLLNSGSTYNFTYNSHERITGITKPNSELVESYTFDEYNRLSECHTEQSYKAINLIDSLIYDDNWNVIESWRTTAYCNTASDYDNSPNPYFAVNKLLGFPFFNEYYNQSYHNPKQILDISSYIMSDLITASAEHEFSYIYDAWGRLSRINNEVTITYLK